LQVDFIFKVVPYGVALLLHISERNDMEDDEKTRDQLINELKAMRRRIQELENFEDARKEAEKALQESEAKFKALAENTTAAIFVIQGEKYLYINPAFTEITGYTFDDLSSMKFWDFIAPDMRDLVRTRGIRRQNKESVASRYDLRFITKYGEERFGNFGATLIEFQNMPAILGTVLDITEHKKAEDLLRQAEEKYRSIFENSVMGIFQATPDGRYLNANREMAWMLGYDSSDEMIGSITDIGRQQFVHPEDRMKLKGLF